VVNITSPSGSPAGAILPGRSRLSAGNPIADRAGP